jgi:hypothetical protein
MVVKPQNTLSLQGAHVPGSVGFSRQHKALRFSRQEARKPARLTFMRLAAHSRLVKSSIHARFKARYRALNDQTYNPSSRLYLAAGWEHPVVSDKLTLGHPT